MAELRFLLDDPAAEPAPEYLLPALRELGPVPRSELLARQIESDLASLGYPPPPRVSDPTTEDIRHALQLPWPPGSRPLAPIGGSAAQPAPAGSAPRAPAQLPQAGSVGSLHTELLLALTARSFSLGKAYGIGVDLAETALVSFKLCTGLLRPARSLDEDMHAVFAISRVNRIAREIRDLKGYFAPYASDAVS